MSGGFATIACFCSWLSCPVYVANRTGALAFGKAPADEFLKLAVLAIGQSIHRINDDRRYAAPWFFSQDVVNNRDDVRQALSRTGAGRQDVIASAAGNADGFLLVSMQSQRLAEIVELGLLDAENLAAGFMQDAFVDQLVDGSAGLERRVELNERLGPEQSGIEFFLDLRVDPGIPDLDEAADVVGVGVDEFAPKIKDVHGSSSTHGSSGAEVCARSLIFPRETETSTRSKPQALFRIPFAYLRTSSRRIWGENEKTQTLVVLPWSGSFASLGISDRFQSLDMCAKSLLEREAEWLESASSGIFSFFQTAQSPSGGLQVEHGWDLSLPQQRRVDRLPARVLQVSYCRARVA